MPGILIFCFRGAYHINELGKLQAHFDSEAIRVVSHRSDEAVIVAQQIVIQSFRIRVGQNPDGVEPEQRHNRPLHLSVNPPLPTIKILFNNAHKNDIYLKVHKT